MWGLTAQWMVDGHWDFSSGDIRNAEDREGIKIAFVMPMQFNLPKDQVILSELSEALKTAPIAWIPSHSRRWLFDLDKLKEQFAFLRQAEWCKGKQHATPELEFQQHIVSESASGTPLRGAYVPSLVFTIPEEPKGRSAPMIEPPIEITESLAQFERDHPDPSKVAFLMVKYGRTDAHDIIIDVIRNALAKHDIVGLLAKDRQYHDNLKENILTYLHGCGFGIAVFERIESNDFNPNVSLEVGYMLALQKPLCYLKDETLPNLHTDIIGTLYKSFDTRAPSNTIPAEIEQWLNDKMLIAPHAKGR